MNKTKQSQRRTPLLVKISASILITAFLILSVFTFIDTRQNRIELTENLQSSARAMVRRLPGSLVYPMFNYENERVEFILHDIFSEELVVGVELTEDDTVTVEFKDEDFSEQSTFSLSEKVIFEDGGEELDLGQVTVYFTNEKLEQSIRNKMISNILQNILLLLLIVIVNALMLYRIVVKPIKTTSLLLESISEGEGDLTQHLKIHSRDEIGELADHFNTFVSKLNKIIGNIKVNMCGTIDIKNDLSSHTEETASAVEEMISNIESSKKQIVQLNDTSKGSIDDLGNINRNIDDTIDHIGNQSSMVEEATAAITEMLSSIDSVAEVSRKKKEAANVLVKTSEAGSAHVNETTQIIAEVAQSVGMIEEMLTLINNVASQTNLLSMNAAIEAAHAGESGKGFAVVADEIRKLAETSGANSKRIAEVLTGMIKKIEEASHKGTSLQTVFSQVEDEVNGVANSLEEITTTMQELSAGSEQIQKAMSGLMNVSESVMTSSNEMRDGAQVLDVSVKHVGDVSTSVTGAMEELFIGTKEIGEAMNNINSLNRNLGDSAEELSQLVEKFKTDN